MLIAALLLPWAALAATAHTRADFSESERDRVVHSGGGVTVDWTFASRGYVGVKHKGTSKRLKARVAANGETYTYDLGGEGGFETFPLQLGDGRYTVTVYQRVSGNSYAQIYATEYKVALDGEYEPYLHPNQYVWYTSESQAVREAARLCEDIADDYEKIKAIYNYIGTNVVYDYVKVFSLDSGYMPEIDEVLEKGTGICFDFSALMAAMLRSQGIPAQLVIGYVMPSNSYHAWNRVLLNGEWRILDLTLYTVTNADNTYSEERHY